MTIDTHDPYVGFHTTTGEIKRITLDNGLAPADGEEDVDGLIAHRIPSLLGLSQNDWHETKVWNGTEYITVARKPNPHSFWDAEANDWDWDPEPVFREIRAYRNNLLLGTDWVFSPDSPLTADQIQEVRDYRQLLRNLPSYITSKPTSLLEIEFPAPPTCLSS